MSSPDFHIIDEYLLNRLEGRELAAFEQQLAQDPTLADEVAQQRQLIAAVDALGDLGMKERVREIHKTEIGRPAAPSPSKNWKWAVATGLLLLTALGLWMVLRPKQQTPVQLYADYYKPYDLNFGSRSTESEQLLTEAGTLYKAGNFEAALPVFEKVLATNTSDSKARLAAGICNLELGKLEQALLHFEALAAANDPLFGEQAVWYSAMVKLKQGDAASCRALLETISKDEESYYHQSAKQLLSALE